ncbi:MAG: hypothetical protein ACRDZV_02445, partial [Acidimicrobiia bacterium]
HHLEHCEACRGAVASLAVTADLVLLAAPTSPPPAGFESRVLSRIGHIEQRGEVNARRRRRWIRPVLVAAAILAVLVVTVVPDGRGRPVSAARMRTSDGTVVGTAHLREDDPARVVVNVTDWEKAGAGRSVPPYRLVIERGDGTRQLVSLAEELDYSWRVSLPAEGDHIVSVALVDRDGSVLCSGHFGAS